ncbi:hypothetical protein DFH06DRAFT_1142789 [Mycena polygramma]|nr:hypothetical protein DFH06DRAFT_1142789 [Mycena polygramma]
MNRFLRRSAGRRRRSLEARTAQPHLDALLLPTTTFMPPVCATTFIRSTRANGASRTRNCFCVRSGAWAGIPVRDSLQISGILAIGIVVPFPKDLTSPDTHEASRAGCRTGTILQYSAPKPAPSGFEARCVLGILRCTDLVLDLPTSAVYPPALPKLPPPPPAGYGCAAILRGYPSLPMSHPVAWRTWAPGAATYGSRRPRTPSAASVVHVLPAAIRCPLTHLARFFLAGGTYGTNFVAPGKLVDLAERADASRWWEWDEPGRARTGICCERIDWGAGRARRGCRCTARSRRATDNTGRHQDVLRMPKEDCAKEMERMMDEVALESSKLCGNLPSSTLLVRTTEMRCKSELPPARNSKREKAPLAAASAEYGLKTLTLMLLAMPMVTLRWMVDPAGSSASTLLRG